MITLKVDPAKLPKSEDLKAHMFPSTLAVAADDQAVRIVTREAFPDIVNLAGGGAATGAVSSVRCWGRRGLASRRCSPPRLHRPAGAARSAGPGPGGPAGLRRPASSNRGGPGRGRGAGAARGGRRGTSIEPRPKGTRNAARAGAVRTDRPRRGTPDEIVDRDAKLPPRTLSGASPWMKEDGKLAGLDARASSTPG